jgi:hypothetical protein
VGVERSGLSGPRCASSCCKAQSNMLQLQNAISQFQPTLDHLFWSSANQPSVVCGRVIGTGVVLASFVFARSPRLASFVFARSLVFLRGGVTKRPPRQPAATLNYQFAIV